MILFCIIQFKTKPFVVVGYIGVFVSSVYLFLTVAFARALICIITAFALWILIDFSKSRKIKKIKKEDEDYISSTNAEDNED